MLAAPLDSFRSRAPPSWLAPTRSSLHPPGHWREESPPAPPIHGIALYLSAMPSDLLSLTRRVLVFFVFSPRQVAAVLNFARGTRGAATSLSPRWGSRLGCGRGPPTLGEGAVMENKDLPHILCIKQLSYGDPLHPTPLLLLLQATPWEACSRPAPSHQQGRCRGRQTAHSAVGCWGLPRSLLPKGRHLAF